MLQRRTLDDLDAGRLDGNLIAVYNTPVNGRNVLVMGESPSDVVPLGRRRGIAQELGYGINELDSVSTLYDVMWRIWTELGDPEGRTAPRPGKCESGVMRLHLGDLSRSENIPGFRDRKLAESSRGVNYGRILERIQNEYALLYEEFLITGVPSHQYLLWRVMRAFDIDDHALFVPPNVPLADPLNPGTLWTDTFTEGTDTALASHTPDVGGFTWVEDSGSWTVRAIQDDVRQTTSGGAARLATSDSDIGSGNHKTIVKCANDTSSSGAYVGPTIRMGATAGLGYGATGDLASSGNTKTYQLDGVTNKSSIGTNTTGFADGDTLELEAGSDDNIIRRRNGTSENEVTDNTRSGQRAGIICRISGGAVVTTADDWNQDTTLAAVSVGEMVASMGRDYNPSQMIGISRVGV